MLVERMSFAETPNWKDCIGFIVRIGLEYRQTDNSIIIQKGSLVYGFKEGDSPAYGYVVSDGDEAHPVLSLNETNYIGINKKGNFIAVPQTLDNVHGLGANVPGIPWYTFQIEGESYALIGKVFMFGGNVTGLISCDDAYWCEYEIEQKEIAK